MKSVLFAYNDAKVDRAKVVDEKKMKSGGIFKEFTLGNEKVFYKKRRFLFL